MLRSTSRQEKSLSVERSGAPFRNEIGFGNVPSWHVLASMSEKAAVCRGQRYETQPEPEGIIGAREDKAKDL
jgi:hypothetical protein